MEKNFISLENENEKFFDVFSAYYEWFYGSIAIDKIVDAWFDALLEAGLKKRQSRNPQDKLSLLDVGCGPGWYINAWHKKGFKVYGLDWSSNMIALARKKLENKCHSVTFFVDDVRNIGASEVIKYKFDIITSHFNFFNLFPANELKLIFQNINLLAQPGCYWITDYSIPKRLPQPCTENYNIGNGKTLTRRGFWNKQSNCFEHTWERDGKNMRYKELYWFHSHATYSSLLMGTGWTLEKCYQSQVINGNLTLSPFLDEAEHVVIILRKGGG